MRGFACRLSYALPACGRLSALLCGFVGFLLMPLGLFQPQVIAMAWPALATLPAWRAWLFVLAPLALLGLGGLLWALCALLARALAGLCPSAPE